MSDNTTTPRPSDEALAVTPEMIGAAWGVWKARHGGLLGPGPAFREAIEAALSVSPLHRRIAELEGENAKLSINCMDLLKAVSDEASLRGALLAHATAAEARAARDAAEIERLRGALKPFCFGDPILERILYDGMPDEAPCTFTIKLGDCRRARSLLTKDTPDAP